MVMVCCGASVAGSGCGGRHPVAASTPPPIAPAAMPTESDTARLPETATRKSAGSLPRRDLPERTDSGGYTEEGNASWYGPPFHGRRASNGEVYDMNKLTAAHRTMAFNTM